MKQWLRTAGKALSAPAIITLATFVVRFWAMMHVQYTTPAPPMEYFKYGYEAGNVAAAIASGHGFSSPLDDPTGATAWFTPLYPYLLAGIFKLFGVFTYRSMLVALTLNCVFSAFTSLAVYHIGREAFSKAVGVGAAWFWAFMPVNVNLFLVWIWDTSLIAMLLTIIVWATLRMREARSLKAWVGYGALWAVGILTNPAVLSVLPLVLLWLVFSPRGHFRQRIRLAGAAALVVFLGIAPWIVRNSLVFGTFVGLRSNLGLELYLGNNDKATDSWPYALHPSISRVERAKFRQIGEIAYMQEKQQEALHYMRTYPGEAAHWALRRFLETWTGTSDPLLDMLSYASWQLRLMLIFHHLFPLLTFLGLLLASRNGKAAAFPMAAVILCFPVIYYLTHASLRYRHPIDPLMAVLSVYAVGQGISQIARRFYPEAPGLQSEPTAGGYSEAG